MTGYVTASSAPGAVGRLADGTPYFAPLGEMAYDSDEDRVQCHLCGGWFRIVGSSHLISKHGWSVAEYRRQFGLLAEDPTCAAFDVPIRLVCCVPTW